MDEHITQLSRAHNAAGHKVLFDHLYDCLGILDSKSQALLSFNSIIVAAFALITGDRTLVTIGMALSLVSCVLCLLVVWVHWSRTGDMKDLDRHARILLAVRKERTIEYRLAWYLSVSAVLVMLSLVAQRH